MPRRPAGINGFEGSPAIDGSTSKDVDPREYENMRLNDDGSRLTENYAQSGDSDQEEREDIEMG